MDAICHFLSFKTRELYLLLDANFKLRYCLLSKWQNTSFIFFSTGMFLNMAQVPPRFYNQQIQQQRDNYQQTKKNYYRAGSSGMSQEHQGSASQVSYKKYSNFFLM